MPEPQVVRQIDPYELAKSDPAIARRIQEAEQYRREELAAVLARQQGRPAPAPEDLSPRLYAPPIYPVTQEDAQQRFGEPDSTAHSSSNEPTAPAEESHLDGGWDVAPPAKPSKGGKHPGGRPRRVAPWFEPVAHAMKDGTSVRVALVRCGVHLTEREIKSLYRLRAFKVLYQRERREHLKRWGLRGVRVNDHRKFFRGPRL